MTAGSVGGVIRIGTRGSRLALWQARRIGERMREEAPGCDLVEVIFTTRGDRELEKPLPSIGGKGVFTEELEAALRSGDIDVAVHSLKDLPTGSPPGIVVGAVCCRADVRDALVSRTGEQLANLPEGAIVGTSSTRRMAQLAAMRPDLRIRPIRGNVETRVRKVMDGEYDGAVLAAAGLSRLDMSDRIAELLPLETFLPAPGQGALAVQCREGDGRIGRILERVNESRVRACTDAERAFLSSLGGGCSVPVAAFCEASDSGLELRGFVGDPSGGEALRARASAPVQDAVALGRRLADRLLAEGAAALLA